jgi:hypothetical protein
MSIGIFAKNNGGEICDLNIFDFKTTSTMPLHSQQIQDLLKEDKIQEALNLFVEIAPLEAQLMQARFDRLMQLESQGKDDTEFWHVEHNRILYALREMSEPGFMNKAELRNPEMEAASNKEAFSNSNFQNLTPKTKITPQEAAPQIRKAIQLGNISETNAPFHPDPKTRKKILQLLREHHTEQALALCVGFGDQYLLLQTELLNVKKLWHLGVLEADYFEATKNRINLALQEFLKPTQQDEDIANGFWSRLIRIFK